MARHVISISRQHDTLLVAADKTYFQVNVGGAMYYLDSHCPHKGGPLHKGKYIVANQAIACPWHRLEWSITELAKEALPVLNTPNTLLAVSSQPITKRRNRLTIQEN